MSSPRLRDTPRDLVDAPDPIIPPTFLAASRMWMGEQYYPYPAYVVDRSRVLHGAQRYRYFGPPPRAGAKLIGRRGAMREYEKEGARGGRLRFIELVTDFADEAGTLVAEACTTFVVTQHAAAP